MNFFNSIFLAVATFFGFGTAPVENVVVTPVDYSIEVSPEGQIIKETESENVMAEDNETELTNESPIIMDEMNESNKSAEQQEVVAVTPDIKTLLVAGGCFWCVESDLEKIPGVIEVVSGYAGGTTENPTYQNYGAGGHREVVEVTYDANKVSFEEILIVAMKTTDPTDDDGTFADRGDKYSSAFYYETPEQKDIIEKLISDVDANGPYEKPLAIDVESRPQFWRAEDYHQDYYKGVLSKLKYQYYRKASGRDAFIEKYWSDDHTANLPWRNDVSNINQKYMWSNYVKPSKDVLEEQLEKVAFEVTQEEGTERSGTSPLDKNYEEGIYVDILSGEPLFSSKDKFDSGTGWPSFVRPINPAAVTEREDNRLFSKRIEIRSTISDNHLGHVFNDGPKDSTGLRYCMNGAALKFIPKDKMEAEGYADFLPSV